MMGDGSNLVNYSPINNVEEEAMNRGLIQMSHKESVRHTVIELSRYAATVASV